MIDGYPEYPKEVPCTECGAIIMVDQPNPEGWICTLCLIKIIEKS
jgi:hypothetical protein